MSSMKLSQAQKIFGETLRTIRESRCISQEALALASGYERAYISMLESGKRRPSFKAIIDLSDALEIAPGELFRNLPVHDVRG